MIPAEGPCCSGRRLREEDRRREAGVSNRAGHMHEPGGVMATPFTHTIQALGTHGTSIAASRTVRASMPASGEASTAAESGRVSPAAPPSPADPADPPAPVHATVPASGTRAASTSPHPTSTAARSVNIATVFIVLSLHDNSTAIAVPTLSAASDARCS